MVTSSRPTCHEFQPTSVSLLPLKIFFVGMLMLIKFVEAQSPPTGMVWEFGERVLGQVPSSSPNHGSKL
ncbi:hypothetical protein TNCV_4637951 [Trichonephila clavipes]|uniref:Uncharacterized protein n=1 Tax=Trichonephila clavipes TaxID=2585209 RepID=A0A8X7BJH9_TRICX|nr:hypothetical protein TNCV_4637951 [Trichonephila clavipes]